MNGDDLYFSRSVSLSSIGISEGVYASKSVCSGYNTLSGYLDKNLKAKERKSFEDHLAACRECRTDLIDMRGIMKEIENVIPEK